jgi:S-adenosylmethionine:tRNA ribosyltransferase-isomerase
MLTKDLAYDLPPERIAQFPAGRRDESRLLVHVRATGETSHHTFRELPYLLPAKTNVFRNDVSVLKARLLGQRASGGAVECLLLRPNHALYNTWSCLLKPGAKTEKAGAFSLPGEYKAVVLEKDDSGEYIVRFELSKDNCVNALADRLGTIPLPPYVRRLSEASDEDRYQTIYSDPGKRTAVASPTAGLHFTTELVDELRTRGHAIHDLTLSVGLGTFRPIETERIEDHVMHAEPYSLPPTTKIALREPSIPRLSIGTTTARAIEHHLAQDEDSTPEGKTKADADLFICPPHHFQGVDLLLTNFHLPGSTLLCMVAAFLSPGKTDGLVRLKELYSQAISLDYRFYSYGDAMLIL